MKTHIWITLLCFAAGTAFAQPQPAWVTTGKHPKYPQDLYWIGVGQGMGARALDEAKSKAKAEIAKQFKVTVSSKTKLVQTEKIVGNSALMTSDLEDRIETQVDKMTLTGLEIAETFESKVTGKAFALAVLNREEFTNTLKTELEAEIAKIREKIASGASLSEKGDIGSAVNAYMEALALAEDVGPKVVFFNIVAKGYALPEDVRPEFIESQVRDELSMISLKKVSGDNQRGKIGENLPMPFVVQALSKGQPIRGVPITFKAGDEIVETVITGEDGMAKLEYVVQAVGIKGNKGKVTATIDLSRLSASLRSELRNITTLPFDFTVEGIGSFACDVEMADNDITDGQNAMLAKMMVQALEKNGVTVKRNAPIVARGSFTAREAGTVQSLNGQMVLQDITFEVFFINRNTQSVLSSVSVNVKGLGRDSEDALQKGLNSLRLPPAKLSEAIGKARLAAASSNSGDVPQR
ncbi:MAG: LPP20 family lipoprotein [Chloroherpetonaceae bacterium]|nr:LPP20 family lipoprotein [Chloroherpetonaceae bacterium]MDW8018668.1 LPP20 family lipoprotein [Chloroherpetonaceae bacterium]